MYVSLYLKYTQQHKYKYTHAISPSLLSQLSVALFRLKVSSSCGLSHRKKVKPAGRMAIKPLKWYYQWNMIDQLNSIAQKNVGLSRVLYAQ